MKFAIHKRRSAFLIVVILVSLAAATIGWLRYTHTTPSDSDEPATTQATKRSSKPGDSSAPTVQLVSADMLLATTKSDTGTTYEHYTLSPESATVSGVAVPEQVPTSAFAKKFMEELKKSSCKNDKGCVYFLWKNATTYAAAKADIGDSATAIAEKYKSVLYGVAGTKISYTYYSTAGDAAASKAQKLDNAMMPIDD